MGTDELEAKLREMSALVASLREREARHQTLFEQMDDGYCIIEVLHDGTGRWNDYRFLEANTAFVANTGLVDSIGKTVKEMVPAHEDHWFALYGDVARTGEPARFIQEAAGLGRWYDVFATRVGEPEKNQVGVLFKDITARHQLDADRERVLRMEQAARRDAEEANRLKDEFLATVSHELRTPLNAILGYTTLLRGADASAEQQRMLAAVERNARAQAQLIEDLLDISRMLAGKLRLDMLPTDLPGVVEAAIDTVRPAADVRSILLDVALEPGAVVMGDAHRLQQIVWNLLSNAVKFTPKGGNVRVLLVVRDAAVEVTVTDTGIGIAAEFLPHVFERFRQADGGTTRAHAGLGLGLSIVRQLVELHGGTITVASEGKGQGATFTVRLPLAEPTSRPSAPPRSHKSATTVGVERPPELEGLDVLVVDDEADSAEMVSALLASCGAKVRIAHSASEAFEELGRESPDILLSDIGMPDEDGFSLIGRIRELAADAGGNVAAVALTAYARGEDRTRALRAGFDSHVPKPLEPAELLAVLASLASRRRVRP